MIGRRQFLAALSAPIVVNKEDVFTNHEFIFVDYKEPQAWAGLPATLKLNYADGLDQFCRWHHRRSDMGIFEGYTMQYRLAAAPDKMLYHDAVDTYKLSILMNIKPGQWVGNIVPELITEVLFCTFAEKV